MSSVDELKAKLEETRLRVRKLTVIGLRDNLTPQEREAVRDAERSARAELILRRKALDYAEKQG